MKSFDVTWISDTHATIHAVEASSSGEWIYDYTFRHYPSTDAASAYFDSQRYPYPSKDTISSETVYQEITGKWPSVFKSLTSPALI